MEPLMECLGVISNASYKQLRTIQAAVAKRFYALEDALGMQLNTTKETWKNLIDRVRKSSVLNQMLTIIQDYRSVTATKEYWSKNIQTASLEELNGMMDIIGLHRDEVEARAPSQKPSQVPALRRNPSRVVSRDDQKAMPSPTRRVTRSTDPNRSFYQKKAKQQQDDMMYWQQNGNVITETFTAMNLTLVQKYSDLGQLMIEYYFMVDTRGRPRVIWFRGLDRLPTGMEDKRSSSDQAFVIRRAKLEITDAQSNDLHAGHILANIFNAPGKRYNLVSMPRDMNISTYKKMENQFGRWVDNNGYLLWGRAEIQYEKDRGPRLVSHIPTEIVMEVSAHLSKDFQDEPVVLHQDRWIFHDFRVLASRLPKKSGKKKSKVARAEDVATADVFY